MRTAKVLAQLTQQVAVFQYPDEQRVILAGTANIAKGSAYELAGALFPILEALEEQVVLLRLLSDAASFVQVRIGDEQLVENLKKTSLVSVGYGFDGNSSGALGIIGPTRMNYANTIAAVNAVARYIGQFLGEHTYG
jgi:transcriptional regulator of heat shock response